MKNLARVTVASLAGLSATTLTCSLPTVAAETQLATASSWATQAGVIQPWPVLTQGARGVQVRSLQYLLNARGAGLAVDGVFGPRTKSAVVAFQHSRGLVATGVVGQATWLRLIMPVQRGSAGWAVRAVQDQMNFRNLSGIQTTMLAVDGLFGPKTDAKVRGFQSAIALEMPFAVDGIVGPRTWQALITGALSF